MKKVPDAERVCRAHRGYSVVAFRVSVMAAALLFSTLSVLSATIEVGSGSYTTTFPGVDSAGRNRYPSGKPQLSGKAAGRPAPSNDWWSTLLKQDHADNLFNYPLTMRTLPIGLDIGRVIPVSGVNGCSEPLSELSPVIVGVTGLAATRVTIADYSDWTVTMAWKSGRHSFRATAGIGMPFVYFSKASADTASVKVNAGTVTSDGEMLLITDSQGGANFAVYAPVGSAWIRSGNTYTSSLAGRNYWSLAILPAGTPATVAADLQQYAYVEPTNTEVSWYYDESRAALRTEFTTTVEVHEGRGSSILQGLLPHQWAHLAPDAPVLSGQSLDSIRGELKLLASNTFATERTFHGILPTLPAVGALSPEFDPAKLYEKIALLENISLDSRTDTYNEGQLMNRLIQTARIAHETGNIGARDKLIATVKERLEDWLSAKSGEVAFLFYYQPTWKTLIGYPASHGQDADLNDHHYHWGYFIQAAAFMEQFEPGWASQWGNMVNLLVRDAASPNRNDTLFPFLRNFSPFAGHSWANGFAANPIGNDQESSSESMQFHTSLIKWGAVIGSDAIRDLGIYLYTTEQSAIEEYWFDIHRRTFKPGYDYALASRIWGNGYDNRTFWTTDIGATYGIELYPINGGSFYLGHNFSYAADLWAEMAANTGILSHEANDNLWHDVYWQFLAFTDPAAAIALYNSNPDRKLKFGVSDVQTYYWLHGMNSLGRVDAGVTADDPLAVVFNKEGARTYVAQNYSSAPKTVQFSDGASLVVPARTLCSSLDLPFSGVVSTPFPVAPVGNSVTLTLSVEGDPTDLTAVEFFAGTNSLGTLTQAPYVILSDALDVGRHTFYARLYGEDTFVVSGMTQVTVGDTVPYSGAPIPLPGTFEAGHYDVFEGGTGQNITYYDGSIGNKGDYRPSEFVDAAFNPVEGAVVGWPSSGEWLDYTVDVAASGRYTLDIRYASGEQAGGGPLYFELDGQCVSADMSFPPTGDWGAFRTATLPDIALTAGLHTLRLNFRRGAMNVGRLTFTYSGAMNALPPEADAGADGYVPAPNTACFLNGSGSKVSDGKTVTYYWEQVAGPAMATLSDRSAADPCVSGLTIDGIYRFRLTVKDGSCVDMDEVDIMCGVTDPDVHRQRISSDHPIASLALPDKR